MGGFNQTETSTLEADKAFGSLLGTLQTSRFPKIFFWTSRNKLDDRSKRKGKKVTLTATLSFAIMCHFPFE